MLDLIQVEIFDGKLAEIQISSVPCDAYDFDPWIRNVAAGVTDDPKPLANRVLSRPVVLDERLVGDSHRFGGCSVGRNEGAPAQDRNFEHPEIILIDAVGKNVYPVLPI